VAVAIPPPPLTPLVDLPLLLAACACEKRSKLEAFLILFRSGDMLNASEFWDVDGAAEVE